MDRLKLTEEAFKKFEEVWSAKSRPHPFKYFKGCLPQILLDSFLHTLSDKWFQQRLLPRGFISYEYHTNST